MPIKIGIVHNNKTTKIIEFLPPAPFFLRLENVSKNVITNVQNILQKGKHSFMYG